jgi:hypothetical protein
MNILNLVASLWKDFKYGVRQLRSNPGFALAAILSLALGIGANSAIFTLVDQILLRLLPVESPRELVQLRLLGGRFGSNNGDGRHTFSHPLYLALREQNTVFSGLTGQYIDEASLVGDERSEGEAGTRRRKLLSGSRRSFPSGPPSHAGGRQAAQRASGCRAAV